MSSTFEQIVWNNEWMNEWMNQLIYFKNSSCYVKMDFKVGTMDVIFQVVLI